MIAQNVMRPGSEGLKAAVLTQQCHLTCNTQVAKYGLDTLDASGGRLGFLPEEIRERPEMACLTDVNLSRNQLFNSDHVFGILSCLKSLR